MAFETWAGLSGGGRAANGNNSGDCMLPERQKWVVVCDFDGTISTVDATDRILEAYADPAWLDIEAEWKSGYIGSRECLSRQIALLRADPTKIDALADTIAIDPMFRSFAQFCERANARLVIVSDGLDSVITRILDRYDLGHLPVYANSLIATGRGFYRLISPHQDADCCSMSGTCKCAVITDLPAVPADPLLLFVGDGQSDFCAAARMADVVAAKSKLLAHMRSIGRACVPFENFGDVQSLLESLINVPAVSETAIQEMLHECN